MISVDDWDPMTCQPRNLRLVYQGVLKLVPVQYMCAVPNCALNRASLDLQAMKWVMCPTPRDSVCTTAARGFQVQGTHRKASSSWLFFKGSFVESIKVMAVNKGMKVRPEMKATLSQAIAL